MSKVFSFIGIIVGTQFIVSLPAIADTTWVSGVISTNTVWDPTGNPYIVTENVLVDSAVTLDIEPGVEVRIDSANHIMIKGTMNAIGTVTDSIIISARDTTKRWSRLWFKDASAGSLCYCRIEYAGNSAIYDSSASLLVIEYNTITGNSAFAYGGGIYSRSSPTISYNTISGNSSDHGGGICSYGSPTITGNIITGNSAASYGGGGIAIYDSPTITGNTITNNSALGGGGICSYDSPTITNNTISNNSASAYYGGGIYFLGSPTIKYNTITDTTASAIYIYSSDSALIDSNNIYATGYAVYNNSENDINARYNYWGTVSNDTIDMKIWDFYDKAANGIVYYEPFLPDSLEVGIEERESQVTSHKLQVEVYPNPSFGNTLIKYGLSEKAAMTLKLYDISGRLVKTLYSGTQEKGYYEVSLSRGEVTSPLPAGIYFIRFEAGNFRATKKLTILR